jgi:hypothetical protein
VYFALNVEDAAANGKSTCVSFTLTALLAFNSVDGVINTPFESVIVKALLAIAI